VIVYEVSTRKISVCIFLASPEFVSCDTPVRETPRKRYIKHRILKEEEEERSR
jgi:hypothetical protein